MEPPFTGNSSFDSQGSYETFLPVPLHYPPPGGRRGQRSDTGSCSCGEADFGSDRKKCWTSAGRSSADVSVFFFFFSRLNKQFKKNNNTNKRKNHKINSFSFIKGKTVIVSFFGTSEFACRFSHFFLISTAQECTLEQDTLPSFPAQRPTTALHWPWVFPLPCVSTLQRMGRYFACTQSN